MDDTVNALVTCHGCERDARIAITDLTIHLSIDHVTHTYLWLCRACGHTNERPVHGYKLYRLIGAGVPVIEPEELSITFASQLNDPELTAAYMKQWARQ